MPDTVSTAELQDLHVQSLPARTVMTMMAIPTTTDVGGLSGGLHDFTGRQSISLDSSSTDSSSTDSSSTDSSSTGGSSTGGSDGQAGKSGKSG